jgi:hypothetical protein
VIMPPCLPSDPGGPDLWGYLRIWPLSRTPSPDDLRHRCERAAAILGWPNAPYADGLREPAAEDGTLGCALAASD